MNKFTFKLELEKLHKYYKPKQKLDEIAEVYYESLKSIDIVVIKRAFTYLIKSSQWFPKIADIHKVISKISSGKTMAKISTNFGSCDYKHCDNGLTWRFNTTTGYTGMYLCPNLNCQSANMKHQDEWYKNTQRAKHSDPLMLDQDQYITSDLFRDPVKYVINP